MTDKSKQTHTWKKIDLGSKNLKEFFVRHLDRIYAAKRHVVAKLPSIENEAAFADLKETICETITDTEKQLTRMELIYSMLDETPSSASINGLSGLIEDAFEAINQAQGEPEMRDLSIIFYLQNIASIEMSSFQVLQMAAVKLKNKHINKLLKENYDDAKADRTLLLLICSKYITN